MALWNHIWHDLWFHILINRIDFLMNDASCQACREENSSGVVVFASVKLVIILHLSVKDWLKRAKITCLIPIQKSKASK